MQVLLAIDDSEFSKSAQVQPSDTEVEVLHFLLPSRRTVVLPSGFGVLRLKTSSHRP
jgi:hypothetical protein